MAQNDHMLGFPIPSSASEFRLYNQSMTTRYYIESNLSGGDWERLCMHTYVGRAELQTEVESMSGTMREMHLRQLVVEQRQRATAGK